MDTCFPSIEGCLVSITGHFQPRPWLILALLLLSRNTNLSSVNLPLVSYPNLHLGQNGLIRLHQHAGFVPAPRSLPHTVLLHPSRLSLSCPAGSCLPSEPTSSLKPSCITPVFRAPSSLGTCSAPITPVTLSLGQESHTAFLDFFFPLKSCSHFPIYPSFSYLAILIPLSDSTVLHIFLSSPVPNTKKVLS